MDARSHPNRRRRHYVMGGVLGVCTLTAAWLGCNSLLDISDPAFIPLSDAGGDAALADGAIAQTGPVVASRRAIRVPRGERSSFTITVDPTGKTGAVQLTAKPLVTQDVAVFQVPDGTNRFKVTLTAKPEAGAIDEKLIMQAVTDQANQIIGSTEIRVLVGLPGTFDPSFGALGAATIIGAPAQVQFAVVGTSTLFVAEDNTVQELGDDGVAIRSVFGLDTKGKTECGISAIAADPGTILVTGYCPQGNEDFLAQGARTLDAGTAPIEVVPQQDLFKVTRFADAGWYLALSPDGGTEVHAWPEAPAGLLQGTSAHVPVTLPTSLVPGDGGLMIIGREEDPTHITEVARLVGTPLKPPTNFGDGGVGAIDIAEGPPTQEPAVGITATSGNILVATPLPTKIATQGFSTKGFPTTSASLDGFTMVAVAADRKDRFVVVASGSDGKAGIRRFKSDGALDDVFGTNPSVNNCQHGQVAVDDDGMIVVFCPATPKSLVYRVWP